MPKGAKKGENRFKGAQTAAVEARVSRFQEHVAPKMKTFCDYSYIPNKTTFQKLCMDVFNEDLPVNMKKITHRAIANNAKYWNIVGVIYYSHYDSDNAKSLNQIKKEAIVSLNNNEKLEALEQEVKQLRQENKALKTYISKNTFQLADPNENSEPNHEMINNLIATIDFLIKATEGVVEIDKKERSITNLALDIHGVLSKSISCTYFDIMEGKYEPKTHSV